MENRKTLEDVLTELKEAEKEYKEKCLKYGITEKIKRKKKDDTETDENSLVEEENISENIDDIEQNQDKTSSC